MKIVFSAALCTLAGAQMMMSSEDETPATLGLVCIQAVLTHLPDDPKTPGLSAKLFGLAIRLNGADEVEIDAADVDLLKRRLESIFPPLIVGQAWNLLEGRAPFSA